MPSTSRLACRTCGSDETHQHLTKKQEEWLRKKRPGLPYTHDWWKCAAAGCRTLRYRWDQRQWEQLPDDD